jgi:hypothetical protein
MEENSMSQPSLRLSIFSKTVEAPIFDWISIPNRLQSPHHKYPEGVGI